MAEDRRELMPGARRGREEEEEEQKIRKSEDYDGQTAHPHS